MTGLNINNAEFIKSAAAPEGFLRDSLPSIVFAGKSNVGKSSVINRLLNRRNFARVGEAPGKTIHVNYFLIDRRVHFVDLPGYGYAPALVPADGGLLLRPRADHAGGDAGGCPPQAHGGRCHHGGVV